MNTFEFMLARKQGGGNGGGGGKSKVLYFKEDAVTAVGKYPVVDAGDLGTFIRISSEGLSYDEVVGGIVGSTVSLSTGTNGALMCYPILPVEEVSNEQMMTNAFAADSRYELGFEGGAIISLGAAVVAFSVNAAAAEVLSNSLGANVSEGTWINIIMALAGREDGIIEFALAYNAKETEEEEWFNDGNTHIWIELEEGRTSPALGLAVRGTATVDWGDGTEPDVLSGTSTITAVYTPNHEYAKAGNYIVTLTIDGKASLVGMQAWGYASYVLVHAKSADIRNREYARAIKKIEIGSETGIGGNAFRYCSSLQSVTIPDSVTSIGSNAFSGCSSLQSIIIPDSVTSIDGNAFTSCSGLQSIIIPDSVTSIGNNAFASCYSLQSIIIPDNVTIIGGNAFSGCSSLQSIIIPDGVTSIGNNAFSSCSSLQSVTIPDSVTSIDSNAFAYNNSMFFYDFSECTDIPALNTSTVFNSIPSGCEIRVPAALAEAWKAATNWSTYADKIVGV